MNLSKEDAGSAGSDLYSLKFIKCIKYTELQSSGETTLELGKFYRGILEGDLKIILPVSTLDTSVVNEVALTVKYGGPYEIYFWQEGDIVPTLPETEHDFDEDDVVNYTCKYEPLMGRWYIYPCLLSVPAGKF